MNEASPPLPRLRPWLAAALASLIAACGSPPTPPAVPTPVAGPVPVAPAPGTPAPAAVAVPAARPVLPSAATTPRAYRADAARHLYERHPDRIWKGRLPPMLHAIGVLDVELDARGEVRGLRWQRAPRHAPEVMAEIERTVRAAAPYPAPARMGKVVYTDVWLWHASGKFQLDTLTEGQD